MIIPESQIACVASVSVLFPSKDRAKNGSSKRGGGGEERKETLWLSFHFSRGQNRESRSSVFLCSETARKRLLRRLNHKEDDIIEKINQAHHGITTCQLCPVHSNVETRARKCYNQHNVHSNGCIERQPQSVKNILDKPVKSQWTGWWRWWSYKVHITVHILTPSEFATQEVTNLWLETLADTLSLSLTGIRLGPKQARRVNDSTASLSLAERWTITEIRRPSNSVLTYSLLTDVLPP